MQKPDVVLSERYRLSQLLGAGGMGEVWRAQDLLLNRVVAVKLLLPALAADASFTARFLTEAQLMASVNHPGIIDVYDYGESVLPDNTTAVYLVMRCIDGESLSTLIEREGRLSTGRALEILRQAAQALAAAHAAGIVHRDVKPANLLITSEGTVMLADFGVSRSVDATSVTGPNAVLGTARYMAPEQALGQPATAEADIYSLGAVGYHCLAGHPPFTGDTPVAIALHHVQDTPAPLPSDVPREVADLVDRAMAKEPALRFPSGEAFAAAITHAAGMPSGSAPFSEPGQTAPIAANPSATTGFAAGRAPLRAPGPPDDTLTEAVLAQHEPISRRIKVGSAAAVLMALVIAVFVLANGLTGETSPSTPVASSSKPAITSKSPKPGRTATRTAPTPSTSLAPLTPAQTRTPATPATTAPNAPPTATSQPATTAAPEASAPADTKR